jgi:hypothetical protein
MSRRGSDRAQWVVKTAGDPVERPDQSFGTIDRLGVEIV